MVRVEVLRLGHRLVRDDRTTTHVALVSRAFGAEKIYIVGGEEQVKKTVNDVSARWGKGFEVELLDEWRPLVQRWKKKGGIVVHLTMYGSELESSVKEIRSQRKDSLVVVGGAKVPRSVLAESDFNVSVGNQPHSEIAALAVFLDHFFAGEELKRSFSDERIRIVPSSRRKKVEVLSRWR